MPTRRMYLYSLLSVSLWVVLLYLPLVYFSPRGHHLSEGITWGLICCAVLILSFLMAWGHKLFSYIKNISALNRDIIFVLGISYFYLPISIFSMYMENMEPSTFSIGMLHILFNIKLYILGIAVAPAPLLFVYLLRRAERMTQV